MAKGVHERHKPDSLPGGTRNNKTKGKNRNKGKAGNHNQKHKIDTGIDIKIVINILTANRQ
jgi:hypothetical protein